MSFPLVSAATTTSFASSVSTQAVDLSDSSAGDLLLIALTFRNITTVTPPSGWTLLGSQDSDGVGDFRLYYRIADGTEGATATFTTSATTTGVAHCRTIIGQHSTDPIEASFTSSGGVPGSTATPTLEFTGTDPDGDDLRYNVQIRLGTHKPTLPIEDDFNDDSINTDLWANWGGSNVVATNQQLELTSATAQFSFYGIETVDNYDLTDSGVSTEVVQVGNLAGVECYLLLLEIDATNSIYFSEEGGNLIAKTRVNDTFVDRASATLSATNHKYVRIRHESGTFYWETSADGEIWNTFFSLANPYSVPIDDVMFLYMIGTLGEGVPTTTKMIVDNFNILPTRVDSTSGTGDGFANTVTPTDEDPFNSGEQISFTVQEADALDDGEYYWRVRTIDPNGSNTWSDWDETQSFTVETHNPPNLEPSWGSDQTLWLAIMGNAADEVTLTDYPENYLGGAYTNVSDGSASVGVGSAFRRREASAENPGSFDTSVSIWWMAATVAIRSYEGSTTTDVFTSSGSWTAPAGVAKARVRLWGAGGGGGTRSTNGAAGGGGGGAFVEGVVDVTPSESYTVNRGNGGVSGIAGGDTWFDSTSTILAKGGSSGSTNSTVGGGGGSASTSIGLMLFDGGAGADAVDSTNSGGGGGGAGTTGLGGDASGLTAGTGTSEAGGNGGAGRSTQGGGNPGFAAGGAGAGAVRTASGTQFGGPGASGRLEVEYEVSASTSLETNDSAHAHTAESPTLVQSHTLSVDNAIHLQTAENINLAVSITLEVADTSHLHQAGTLDLVQGFVLTVDGANHPHQAENVSLTQAHQLALADSTHSHQTEELELAQAHALTVQTATHQHQAQELTLTQAHVLSLNDATHPHQADSLILSLSLLVADSTHTHTAATLALQARYSLEVSDSTHNHISGQLDLVQAHVLQIDDANHAHTADQVPVSTAGMLAILPAVHGHAADHLTLTQAHTLVVQDAAHAHQTDEIDLTQAHTLNVASSSHPHTAEGVSLAAAGVLGVVSSLHALTSDEVALLQAHQLEVEDSTHTHTEDQVGLGFSFTLSIEDGNHATTSDTVGLGVALSVEDTSHQHQATELGLLVPILLSIQDAFHAHTAQHRTLTVDAACSPSLFQHRAPLFSDKPALMTGGVALFSPRAPLSSLRPPLWTDPCRKPTVPDFEFDHRYGTGRYGHSQYQPDQAVDNRYGTAQYGLSTYEDEAEAGVYGQSNYGQSAYA